MSILPTLTYRRLEWLQLVAIKPGSVCHSRVGFDCKRLGWTEWNYRARDGTNITQAEARERFGDRYYNHCRIHGERITEAGQRILEEVERHGFSGSCRIGDRQADHDQHDHGVLGEGDQHR